MATQPQPTPPKPSTPPPPSPKPSEPPKPAAGQDPQEAKLDPPVGPPRWEKAKAAKPVADGMSSADEQRERSAKLEAQGMRAWREEHDQRPADEKPKFDKNAIAGGGAFVSAGAQKQVPGVTPPTKRE